MVLARTNKLLSNISEHFYSLGLRFTGKTNKHLPNPILEAYQVWIRLNQGAVVTPEEAHKLYEWLLVKKGHVARGYSDGRSVLRETSVSLNKLKQDHGLLIEGDWKQLNFPEDTKEYMQTLLERGDTLMKKSRIELLTYMDQKVKSVKMYVYLQTMAQRGKMNLYIEQHMKIQIQNIDYFMLAQQEQKKIYT